MKIEDIHNIMQQKTITIPAWVLYTLVQYTETSVKRGGIQANELTSVGTAYEHGSQYLTQLINQHKPLEKQPLESIPENDVIGEQKVVEKKSKSSKKNKRVLQS